VFAAGNVVRRTNRAVHALREGREAALALHAFLTESAARPEKRPFDSHLAGLRPGELAVFLRGASAGPRSGRETVPFSDAQAAAEARRCLDCGCVKRSDCAFRRAVGDHAPVRRVRLAERPPFLRIDSHPKVVLEPGKCIKCGRCVRITREKGEPLGLAFIGRGFDMTVGVPFGRELKESLTFTAADCVAACPTGALAWKKPAR
jgi:ferredoxin